MLKADWGKGEGSPQRLALIMGMLSKDRMVDIPDMIKDRSNFSMEKYKFLLESPYPISDKCCNVMKKKPAHEYTKQTGRKPIIATMTEESRLRTQKWLENGCNGFDMTFPTSTPMSFWKEQDVLQYIKENNIEIASVYGNIVRADNQITFGDLGLYEERKKLKTTGMSRTGCMFCGFGCHLEKEGEGRFERMKKTHPKQYDYIMRPKEKGGLNYKEVIDWINEHGNLKIRY